MNVSDVNTKIKLRNRKGDMGSTVGDRESFNKCRNVTTSTHSASFSYMQLLDNAVVSAEVVFIHHLRAHFSFLGLIFNNM